MPIAKPNAELAPAQRRKEIAAILAKGLLRWHQASLINAQKPAQQAKNGLEFLGETRLSVPHGSRRFTPRGDGDEA